MISPGPRAIEPSPETPARHGGRQEDKHHEHAHHPGSTRDNRRAHQRVQPVLQGPARSGARVIREAVTALQGSPGYRPGDYALADRLDPRGPVRAVRRRHEAALRHELRWAVGRLHGGLLRLQACAQAFRLRSSGTSRAGACRTSTAVQALHPQRAADPRPGTPRNYGGTVKEIRKAQRVNGARSNVSSMTRRAGGSARAPGARCLCSPKPPTVRRACRTTSPARGRSRAQSRTSPTSTRSRVPTDQDTSSSSSTRCRLHRRRPASRTHSSTASGSAG